MGESKLVVPRRATVEVKGITRSAFLLRGALAASAVYGGSLVGPYVGQAFAQEDGGGGDVEILNFALTLEQLEATFYQEALRQVDGLDGDLQALAEEIGSNESEHVDALTQLIEDLDGQPEAATEFDFGDSFQDSSSFLQRAEELEETGVSAYNGIAPQLQSKEVLAAAASIVQVEARHAALIRMQRGEDPAPVPFDETIDRQEALRKIQEFTLDSGA